MPTSYPVLSPEERKSSKPAKKRSAWRKRLIEAERGFSFGFRNGSTLFAQIFVGLMIVTTALVLGIGLTQWVALVVAMCLGFAAELFHLSVRCLAESSQGEISDKASKLSAAGMVIAMIASLTAILFILGSRLVEIVG